jgi:hypothetical protein
MSAYGYEDDSDYGQDQNGPKALRDALKKAQDDLKARDTEIASLKEQASTLSKQVKSTTLRQALQDAGVDPKYARFAERDEVEPDEAAVKKWVEDNREVYAFLNKPAPGSQNPSDAGDAGTDDEIDPALADAIAAGQRLESNGRPGGSTSVLEALEGADPTSFKSEAELDAFLNGLGARSAAG